jgi:hypothetical protein
MPDRGCPKTTFFVSPTATFRGKAALLITSVGDKICFALLFRHPQTYDHASRLIGLSDGQSSATFTFIGLGDRLQPAIGSVTTQYKLDINNSLTQVLALAQSFDPYGSLLSTQGTVAKAFKKTHVVERDLKAIPLILIK